MKNLILVGALIFSSVAIGQEKTNDSISTNKPYIYEVVDSPAEFPGGRYEMIDYLAKNIQVPSSPNGRRKYSGKTYIKFVVSDQGKISNVKVMKGAENCPECDDSAVNAIRNMPDWIPGLNQGKPVNQWFTLPIIFNIK